MRGKMITSYFSKWQRNYIALGIPREKERSRERKILNIAIQSWDLESLFQKTSEIGAFDQC